ncbi:endothelin-converting enzyme 2-like isoform X2 [Babylonia areolata]|uniref:endothelin-converting enzyme 2-like isoform X2 n=1 Tax=Babylonia areolata TaxID=304850 RepID=UPI003FD19A12
MEGGREPGQSREGIRFSESWTKRRKWIAVLAAVSCLFCVILSITIVTFYAKCHATSLEQKEHVCSTSSCIHTASYISSTMDTSVNPCDDFFQFACGQYAKNNPSTIDMPWVNHFNKLRAEVKKEVRDLLETQNANSSDSIQKAQAFYTSCLQTDAIDQAGTKPLLDLIQSRGGNLFPTLEGANWVDKNWTLSEILTRVPRLLFKSTTLYSIHPLVTMLIGEDIRQANRSLIYFCLGASPLFASSEYFESVEKLYIEFTTALGASNATATQDAKDLRTFESCLQNVSMPIVLQTEEMDHSTVRTLTDKYPSFNWLEFLQREFSSVGIKVTMEEVIVTSGLDNIDRVFDVINSTPRRTLLNYCMWRFIYSHGDFLTTPIRNFKRRLDSELSWTKRPLERWELCSAQTEDFFPDAVSRLYIDKHFTPQKRTQVEEMIVDLKDAFRDIVRESDWMSQTTRKAALDKVHISASDVFQNVMNIHDHLYETSLLSLRQPVDRRSGWPGSVATVNAFYNPSKNTILFPAGILQKPILQDVDVEYVNYGGLGFFVGHEITHGFDTNGGDFDKDGSYRKWWQEDDLKQFEKRADCLVEQYNKYNYPQVNMSVNGTLTLGENIADNGALKETFNAYKKHVAKKGKEPKLPILDFTPDQLFFIGTAQLWCDNLPDSLIPHVLQKDTHSPPRYRVIGPMQNSEDFARAFSCPVGSYMNPEHKCHVW